MNSTQVNQVVRSNKVSAKHESRLNVMLNEMANQNQAAAGQAKAFIPNFNNNQAEAFIPTFKNSQAIPTFKNRQAIRNFNNNYDFQASRNNYDFQAIPNFKNNQAKAIQALPKCRIGNYTPSHVTHDSAQHWAGSVVGAYPNRIATNAAGGFRTRTVDNSEGAVLYIGTNGDSECAFVLAWQNTRFGKLVYVEAGPSEDYECPPWDIIRNKLKVYGGTQSYFKDNETGAEVSAKLASGSDFIAAAAFDITTD